MQKPPLKSAASVISMFIASFLLCVLFGAILKQVGTPGNYVNLLLLASVIGAYVFSGIFGKTMRLSVFQTADQTATPFYSGQSLAAGVISSGIFVFLAGGFYVTGTDALAIFSGFILGIALMTILFSAAINRSEATTIAGFLQPAGQGKLSRLVALVIVLICCALLLHAQFFMIGFLGEAFFGISKSVSILIASLSIGLCILFGGIQSLSLARMLAFSLLASILLFVVAWISFQVTGNPIPQLAFGTGALQAISEIDNDMMDAGLATREEIFDITTDGLQLDIFNHLAVLVSLACGIAAMPHLLQHFRTVPKPVSARRTGLWGLVLVIVVISAIPPVAAFAKLDVYTSLLGLQVSQLGVEAEWIFPLSGLGNHPTITLCGDVVSTAADAIAACGQGEAYFLSPKDISINQDMLMLSSAALNELPELMTAVLATGAMIAIWSTADGLVLVMSNTIAQDGYGFASRPRSPLGVRLFMTRFFIIVVVICSAIASLIFPADAQVLVTAGLALSAASLFPALVLRVWLPKITCSQILWGMIAGFLFTGSLLAYTQLGLDFIPNTGDEARLAIPLVTDQIQPMSTGLIGMIANFIVASGLARLAKMRTSSLSRKKATSDVPA